MMAKEAGPDCINAEIDRLNQQKMNGDLSDTGDDIRISLTSFDRDEGKFPSEKWKTFVAFIFMSWNLVLNLTCLSIVHERMPERTKFPPLPDIFFDLFLPAEWALDVSEGIIVVAVWSTLFIVFIHRNRFIILRRVFLIMGLLYFMRSITMFVTQVPVASTTYYCSPKANKTSTGLILGRVLYMLGGFGLSINGRHTFCGDYIYSGHTVVNVKLKTQLTNQIEYSIPTYSQIESPELCSNKNVM
ncbi:phosphatidylcholine:ceramide cholinephosphotransferase 2-like isoform X2 [Tachypleus tridentatus]|uniref:phosphatidylcholine:ceramide cholinephosphotransferase 2-like isoform X2 n=1 Tax=Tachypleus tridentatus TaxID=6853 RepID=UPI003FCFFE2C